MATRDAYTSQTWEDLPSRTTPITAERIAHIEDGVKNAHDNRALKEIYGDNTVNLGRISTSTIGAHSSTFGEQLIAAGDCSHAEGYGSISAGLDSHAEGYKTQSIGTASHAEGYETIAPATGSHAEGNGTIAASAYQHVQGEYNIPDSENKYAHIVGGGTSISDRKNIHTLDRNGNAKFAGTVTDGNGNSIQPEENIDIDFSTYFS